VLSSLRILTSSSSSSSSSSSYSLFSCFYQKVQCNSFGFELFSVFTICADLRGQQGLLSDLS
jgi:hypothetical protein